MCEHLETYNVIPPAWRPTLATMLESASAFGSWDIGECGCCEQRAAKANDDYVCVWCRYYMDEEHRAYVADAYLRVANTLAS